MIHPYDPGANAIEARLVTIGSFTSNEPNLAKRTEEILPAELVR